MLTQLTLNYRIINNYILKVCALNDFTTKEFQMVLNNGKEIIAIHKLNVIRMQFQSTFIKNISKFYCIKIIFNVGL